MAAALAGDWTGSLNDDRDWAGYWRVLDRGNEHGWARSQGVNWQTLELGPGLGISTGPRLGVWTGIKVGLGLGFL